MVYAFPYHLNKRAAKFKRCEPHVPAINNVTLSPDPPKAGSNLEVKGSATPRDAIINGDLFFFAIIDITTIQYVFHPPPLDICANTECPTLTFNFDINYNLSDVRSFPEKFGVGIQIGPDITRLKACGGALFPKK
ncbi:23633_t:CDS:1 [Cetraspora pellucida]|uniref:23633_t:CDS:1 n=1 Tax=Cetraspora pellucida TaxID=1433469 RepID=A0A9N9P6G0_9GLOM|nr:23633_t:CDS:1 [Cetraspora pellucida]